MLHAVRHCPTGSIGVLGLEGPLDLAGAPGFRREALQVVSDGHAHVVVDLAAADVVDSVGVGLLLGIRRRLQPSGQVVVVAPEAHVRRILDATGASQVVAVVDTLDEALAHLDRP